VKIITSRRDDFHYNGSNISGITEFLIKAMLKLNIDFGTLLICAEGARLLQEDGTGETPQAL
jgi:hypothetical protein